MTISKIVVLDLGQKTDTWIEQKLILGCLSPHKNRGVSLLEGSLAWGVGVRVGEEGFYLLRQFSTE